MCSHYGHVVERVEDPSEVCAHVGGDELLHGLDGFTRGGICGATWAGSAGKQREPSNQQRSGCSLRCIHVARSPLCAQMRANPMGKLRFVHFPRSERDNRLNGFYRRRRQAFSIDGQEYTDCKERHALVAIHESVIARQGKAVSGCQRRNIRAAFVSVLVHRSSQRRVQQTLIAQAARTTKLGEALTMQQ